MNPPHWEDGFQRLQRNLDPNYQAVVINNMEDASRTNNNWDTNCQYSRYTADEQRCSMAVKGLSPPLDNFYVKESDVEDPDGEPLEMDEEDPELRRKRKELREIEEQIVRKKVAIALKKVKPFVEEKLPPGSPCNGQSATCKGASLKDRVNAILQQRNSIGFLSKVQSPKDRKNLSSLSKDGLQQEDHPLKLRVKALMKQRCSYPCVLSTNKEVPDVTVAPPRRSSTSPLKEENNSVNQGFQRFLSVLNKGVDMDLLSRIVNDDSEDLPLGEELLNIHPPTMQSKSNLPLRSESQRSNSGPLLLGHSRSNSGERRTDLPSQERSLSETLSLHGDDEKKNDRRDLSFASRSRSRSPPTVKKKVEEEPKVDEQQAQLQNILKSLGLTLEVEEMSRLADRTQERLYGKKHEGTRANRRGEQESQQRTCHRQDRNSSSSSSSSFSSSSSGSSSRSCSPSPSRHLRSNSRDSRRRRTSERSRSRDRSRDGWTCQNSKEAQRYSDRHEDAEDCIKTSTYQHPFPQNEMDPHLHPDAFSEFPDYSLSHYSEYGNYHSVSYSAAEHSYWTYTQGNIPPSFYPSSHPYLQNTYQHFPGSVVAPKRVYPRRKGLEDLNLLVNPDLSKSEGQMGSPSGPRCLQVVTTKPIKQNNIKQLTKGFKRKRKGQKKKKKKELKYLKRPQAVVRSAAAVRSEPPPVNEEDSGTKQSEEEKQPTEEEIKANLRKKLEAFNQKAKQKLKHPANSLTSLTD